MEKVVLKIKGMHCKSCEMLISDELDTHGVKSKISWELGQGIFEFDPKKVSLKNIKNIIKKEGYDII